MCFRIVCHISASMSILRLSDQVAWRWLDPGVKLDIKMLYVFDIEPLAMWLIFSSLSAIDYLPDSNLSGFLTGIIRKPEKKITNKVPNFHLKKWTPGRLKFVYSWANEAKFYVSIGLLRPILTSKALCLYYWQCWHTLWSSCLSFKQKCVTAPAGCLICLSSCFSPWMSICLFPVVFFPSTHLEGMAFWSLPVVLLLLNSTSQHSVPTLGFSSLFAKVCQLVKSQVCFHRLFFFGLRS